MVSAKSYQYPVRALAEQVYYTPAKANLYSYSYRPYQPCQSLPQLRTTVNPDEVVPDESPGYPVMLTNSMSYYLEAVYISYKMGYYQLVVMRNNRVLTDQNYKTLKGAKIAFQRLYKDNAWQEEVKPNWTQLYPVSGEGSEKTDEVAPRCEACKFLESLNLFSP